jgi:ATP-dependent Clp protease adapter protein ClpS
MSTETRDHTLLEDTISDVFAGLWAVIVHNDAVTTFETVIKALVELFQHTEQAALSLAWMVHSSGSAQVALGSQEFAQDGVVALGARGINASAEPLHS